MFEIDIDLVKKYDRPGPRYTSYPTAPQFNDSFTSEDLTEALIKSKYEAEHCDCMILIGTTGEVYPAATVPQKASAHRATIIEINPSPSLYTDQITDIFIQAEAVKAGKALQKKLFA